MLLKSLEADTMYHSILHPGTQNSVQHMIITYIYFLNKAMTLHYAIEIAIENDRHRDLPSARVDTNRLPMQGTGV